MAASLLSLGLAVASCDNGQQMVQPVYGAPSPPADAGNASNADAQTSGDPDASQAIDAGETDSGMQSQDAEAPDANANEDASTMQTDAKVGDDAGPVPPYGIPPERDAGEAPARDASVVVDAEADAGSGPTPLYGLPPPEDASTPTDAGVAEDARVDTGPAVTPLYGLPPPDRDAN